MILKLWIFITSRLLQFILAYIAFMCWEVANDLGQRSIKLIQKGGTVYIESRSSKQMPEEIAVAVTSGYDGGALAMGLITCACIIGIVWLEVNRLKQRK